MLKRLDKLELALITALFVSLLASLHLALFQKINWDEFYYLSQVHDYARGTFSTALQTIHIHFWQPLTRTSLNEVDQVIVGRMAMWLCLVGTVGAIYAIARTFFTRSAALFAGLVYLSFNYTLIHGTSFRTDPPAAFLIMVCLVIALRARLGIGAILVFSLCAAFAALTTVKVVFYLPAFLAAIIWRLSGPENPLQVFAKIGVMLVLSLLLCVGVYLWHQGTLADADLSGSQSMLSNAASTTLTPTNLFPRMPYLLVNMADSLVPTLILWASLPILALKGPQISGSWRAVIVVLGLALPLATFAVYRNAFPYFFPFIFPPAMVLCAAVFEGVKTRRSIAVALIILCLATTTMSWVTRLGSAKTDQRDILAAVHTAFPDPVAYFDRSGAIARFPKAGFFMSTWGVLNYRNAGVPVLEQALEAQVVPLLLLNNPQLSHAVATSGSTIVSPLFEQDRNALSSNFIPHWGPIWVAGKTIDLTGTAQTIDVHIPGIYTLEAGGPVLVNGSQVAPKDQVTLKRGQTTLNAVTPQSVTLRWGKHLARPSGPAPSAPFFTDF